jgi:hypothetical protein
MHNSGVVLKYGDELKITLVTVWIAVKVYRFVLK